MSKINISKPVSTIFPQGFPENFPEEWKNISILDFACEGKKIDDLIDYLPDDEAAGLMKTYPAEWWANCPICVM